MKARWFWDTECERHITNETLLRDYEDFLVEDESFEDVYPTFKDYINECTSKNGTLEEESIPKERRFAKDKGWFPCGSQWKVEFDYNVRRWTVMEIDLLEETYIPFVSNDYEDCLDYIEVRYICEEEDRIG